MINHTSIDFRNDRLKKIQRLLSDLAPHEHADGINECAICDQGLDEAILIELRKVPTPVRQEEGELLIESLVNETERWIAANSCNRPVIKTIIRAALDKFNASLRDKTEQEKQTFGEQEALSESHLRDTVAPFTGSRFIRVGHGITLGCISEEARDLLDRVMEAWDVHLASMRETQGAHYSPSYYGFAYWLIRWSDLVQPAEVEKCEGCGVVATTRDVEGVPLCSECAALPDAPEGRRRIGVWMNKTAS